MRIALRGRAIDRVISTESHDHRARVSLLRQIAIVVVLIAHGPALWIRR